MPADQQPKPADILFDEAHCGLLLTAQDGCITRVNQTFCQWLGYPREALIGRHFQSLMSLEGRNFHQQYWAPLMQVQGSVAEVKYDLLHRDGQVIPMMLSAIQCEHATGNFHELALYKAYDLHHYERSLLHARMVAERHLARLIKAHHASEITHDKLLITHAATQDRALFAEQMIGIVSHDLRSPLSAIKMAAGLLAMRGMDPKQTRILGHITDSAARAQRLVGDLLDFTLAQVGRGIAVSVLPVDLHALVEGSLEELRMVFPGRALVHVRVGDGPFEADADRFFQLLGNLVANAMAYGAEDGCVTVTTRFEPQAVVLQIHNFGVPIPEHLLGNLFEPMIRGSHDNAELRSVGLGLFIVREIVRAHGGQVVASSSQSAGTTFTATFEASAV